MKELTNSQKKKKRRLERKNTEYKIKIESLSKRNKLQAKEIKKYRESERYFKRLIKSKNDIVKRQSIEIDKLRRSLGELSRFKSAHTKELVEIQQKMMKFTELKKMFSRSMPYEINPENQTSTWEEITNQSNTKITQIKHDARLSLFAQPDEDIHEPITKRTIHELVEPLFSTFLNYLDKQIVLNCLNSKYVEVLKEKEQMKKKEVKKRFFF